MEGAQQLQHCQHPKSAHLFEDDFAEASVEAISLAALRTKQHAIAKSDDASTFDHTFTETTLDDDRVVTTSASTLRRLLSTLLQCTTHQPHLVDPHDPPVTNTTHLSHTLPDTPLPLPLPLPLPSARGYLVHPDRQQLWHMHVLSLPHNAIRAELIDLCAMLFAISTDPHPPFDLLQQWYPPFRSFLSSYLAFEHTVLLPWVYEDVDDDRLLAFRREMAPQRALIAHLLDELANALTLVTTRPLPYIFPMLVRAVRDLVNPVLSYLERQHRVLPSLIHARRSRPEAVNVERLMVNRLDVGLLLRWVPFRSRRFYLRFKYLPISEFMSYFLRGRFHTARHLSVVRAIVGPPHPT